MAKYRHRSDAWVDAIIDKLGGEKAADAFLCDQGAVSAPTHAWREQDGVIRFSVTSDGTTGEGWITRFESKGSKLTEWVKDVLRSEAFQPTNGITTNIAVLKDELFTDNDRITSMIRSEAHRRKLTKPNPEVACLIREKFTDEEIEEMGLIWIIVMHKPIKDSGRPSLLGPSGCRYARRLNAYYGKPDNKCSRGSGFAFAAPPT